MPIIGTAQRVSTLVDDRIKEISHSQMSKLLLKKTMIEIRLELVMFIKILLNDKNSNFSLSEKIGSNLANQK